MVLNVTLKVPMKKKEGPDIKLKNKPIKKIETDLLTRLIVAEAGNQPIEGQQAVANVVMNRKKSQLPYLSGGKKKSITNIISAKNQFEAYGNNKINEVDRSSESYKIAYDIADKAINNKLEDLTDGATHFINTNIVLERSGKLPSWYYNLKPKLKIGDHEFLRED